MSPKGVGPRLNFNDILMSRKSNNDQVIIGRRAAESPDEENQNLLR